MDLGRIGLSFNGGKESLVIFHMFLSKANVVFRIIGRKSTEFEEIEFYLEYMQKIYNFTLANIYEDEIDELKTLYNLDTVILGCRRTDPNCKDLKILQETDGKWPKLMRYFPILDWTYKQVWDYIESNHLTICELYKKGYTSIGNKFNTYPNYLLFDKENKIFRHAKYLTDEKNERIGRIKTPLPLSFSGNVTRGKGMGKKLGFPTANIDFHPQLEEGVYYGKCNIQRENIENVDNEMNMVMSIGLNPQFGDTTCEVHILDYLGDDFYDNILNVDVLGFIRKMEKYNSLEELVEAIKRDIVIAEYCLLKNI